jgi:hypothetical protein
MASIAIQNVLEDDDTATGDRDETSFVINLIFDWQCTTLHMRLEEMERQPENLALS